MSLLRQFMFSAGVATAPDETENPPVDYNTLVEGGTFVPATTLTADVQQYIGYNKGLLYCYGMNTYNGHWWDQRLQTPPAPSDFNPVSVDVAAWAVQAQASGVDYAALTVINEYGFLLYPSEVQYNMPRVAFNGGFSPYYTDPYCVQPGYDQNIVSKFVTEFASRGIEPCFYVGFGANMNLLQSNGGQMWETSNDRHELFIQYYCKLAQEMARKWPRVKYYWIDGLMVASLPQSAMQRLYNALKAINPNIVVIGNEGGSSSFSKFPYDVSSVEEYIAYGNQGFIAGNTLSYGGTPYYVPREIVGTPYSDYSQWYYYDEACPDQPVNNPFTNSPPYVKMQAVSTSTFQGLVNVARNNSRPFLAAMLVKRDGTLATENVNFLNQITF